MKKLATHILRKFKLASVLLICNLFIISSAEAAVTGDVSGSINEVVKAINNFHVTVYNYIEYYKNLLYQQNPNQIPTVKANAVLNTSTTNVMNTTEHTTLSSVQKALTTRDEKEVQQFGTMQISGAYYPQTTGLNLIGSQDKQKSEAQAAINKGDRTLSMDTLFSPIAYPNFDLTELSKNPPYNFIRLTSGLYDVPGVNIAKQFDSLNEQEKKQLLTSLDYQKYQAAVRAYLAQQSVGTSNLFQMLIERIPQKGLGTEAGMSTPNASALQVQQFLAARRSQDKDWYNQMATASPATVSRETLFVLAEIRQQLFQMQLQNERLLATMSIMQLQSNQAAGKAGLQTLGQKIQAQIDAAKGINPHQQPNISIPGLPGQ